MSYNQEVASLVFNTSDLTVDATTYVGTCDEFRTEMTWSNINLRTVLGPMYDKYDTFCLNCPNMFFTIGDGVFGTNARDREIIINIRGLPFTNNTYNSALKTNYNHAQLNALMLNHNGVSQLTRESPRLMFTKNQDICDLTIFYTSLLKDANGTYNLETVSAYPHAIFMMNIYGIEKTDRVADLNSPRLFQ